MVQYVYDQNTLEVGTKYIVNPTDKWNDMLIEFIIQLCFTRSVKY